MAVVRRPQRDDVTLAVDGRDEIDLVAVTRTGGRPATDDRIGAIALEPLDRVVAESPVDRIGTGPADQRVLVSITEDPVPPALAADQVASASAVDLVVAGAAQNLVAAARLEIALAIAPDAVVAGTGLDDVVTEPADQRVVARATVDEVVARPAIEPVREVAAEDAVVTGIAIGRVREALPGHRELDRVLAGPAMDLDRGREVAGEAVAVVETSATGPYRPNEGRIEVLRVAVARHGDALDLGRGGIVVVVDRREPDLVVLGLVAGALASGRVVGQGQGAARERRDGRRHGIGAAVIEAREQRVDEALARLEQGHLADDGQIDAGPEEGLEEGAQVAMHVEQALRSLVEARIDLVDAQPAVVARGETGVAARPGLGQVVQVQGDAGADPALDTGLGQTADAERGPGADREVERELGLVEARRIEVVEIETPEDLLDVARREAIVGPGPQPDRIETELKIRRGRDPAGEAGIEPREDRDRARVVDDEPEIGQIVTKQIDVPAEQQTEHGRRLLEQRKRDRPRFGADLLHEVLLVPARGPVLEPAGLRIPLFAGIGRRGLLADRVGRRHGCRRVPAQIATDDEVAEGDQQFAVLARGIDGADEIGEGLDRVDALLDPLEFSGRHAQPRQVEQADLGHAEIDIEVEQVDDAPDRRVRSNDLIDLVGDRLHETTDHVAEVERHVREDDLGCAADVETRAARARIGRIEEVLVVVQARRHVRQRDRRSGGLDVDIDAKIDIGVRIDRGDGLERLVTDIPAPVATGVTQIETDAAEQTAATVAIGEFAQTGLEEAEPGLDVRARLQRRREVETELLAAAGRSRGVEEDALVGVEAETEPEGIVEIEIDAAVARKPQARRAGIEAQRDRLVEDVVGDQDIEGDARTVDAEFDVVDTRDRPCQRIALGIEDRPPLGIGHGHREKIADAIEQGLLDEPDNALRGRLAVLVGRQQGLAESARITAVGAVDIETPAARHALAGIGDAEHPRAQGCVDEVRGLPEFVTDERQADFIETRLQALPDAREHVLEAGQDEFGIVEQGEEVEGGHEIGDTAPDIGETTPVEAEAQGERVVRPAVVVAVLCRSTERQVRRREEQRQDQLGSARRRQSEAVGEFRQAVAAVVVVASESGPGIEVQRATAPLAEQADLHPAIAEGIRDIDGRLEIDRTLVGDIEGEGKPRVVEDIGLGIEDVREVEAEAEVETRRGRDIEPHRAVGRQGHRQAVVSGQVIGQVDVEIEDRAQGLVDREVELEARILVAQGQGIGRRRVEGEQVAQFAVGLALEGREVEATQTLEDIAQAGHEVRPATAEQVGDTVTDERHGLVDEPLFVGTRGRIVARLSGQFVEPVDDDVDEVVEREPVEAHEVAEMAARREQRGHLQHHLGQVGR